MIAKLLCWLTTYRDTIFTGVVASLIVLALQAFVRAVSIALAAIVTIKWRLRPIWGFKTPGNIHIVSGSIENVSEGVRAAILAGPDADAASTIIAATGLLYPEAHVRHFYSSHFLRDLWSENLIIVGGPVNNSCARGILDQYKDKESPIFDGFTLVSPTGKRYETIYDEQDVPIKDFGVLMRAVNPFDKSKDMLLMAGCDTYGVLAAAKLASHERFVRGAQKSLQKTLGFRRYLGGSDFVAVVECTVLENDIANLVVLEVVRKPRGTFFSPP